jgi:GT2 family glycosyltransferase
MTEPPTSSAIAPISPPSNPNAYLIIPVHNRRQVTLSCLHHLQQNGDLARYKAIVVDDGSTDGTGTAIKQQFPTVIVLTGDGNLWWTGAIAKGMQYASEQGADYFFWLNDDCLPAAGAIAKMVQFMQTNPRSLVGATCYISESDSAVNLDHSGAPVNIANVANGADQVDLNLNTANALTGSSSGNSGDRNAGSNIDNLAAFPNNQKISDRPIAKIQLIPTGAQGRTQVTAMPGEVVKVTEMSGHCVGVPVEVITKIGCPDRDRFPQYFGDCTYMIRARRAGFSAYILGAAQAQHLGLELGLDLASIGNFLLALRCQGKLSAQTSFWQLLQLLFGDRKSIFYLPAQFWYFQEKYGAIVGLLIFSCKLLIWLGQLVKIEVSRLLHREWVDAEEVAGAKDSDQLEQIPHEI